MKTTLVLDIECYRNYFLVMFRRVDTGTTRYYEMFPGQPLACDQIRQIMRLYRVVTFNGLNYDLPILTYALRGATCEQLKEATDAIIVGRLRNWQFEKQYDLKVPREWDHIDLSEVAPGVMISLKQYGGRMHSRTLQDLPIEPSAHISPEQRAQLVTYCANDLQTTIDLWNRLTVNPEDDVIAIRERIGVETDMELRSKSDAQVAEAVIRKAIEEVRGETIYKQQVPAGTTYRYTPPSFIKFNSPVLREKLAEICDAPFIVKVDGKITEPATLKNTAAVVTINGRGYTMGIGGLHSTEKSASHWADDETLLRDVDVVSFYPELIRKCGLAPKNMGPAFTRVYGGFIDRRIAAKKAGHATTAQTLKIFLNGAFGKLGSPYSVLYAPDLLIQVTLTGQLMLLMMIERMEAAGIPVVSANTDGIVLKCPVSLEETRKLIVRQWENEAGFQTEETRYRALCSKDVNNYLALKEKGGAKTKGEYAPTSLMKNAEMEISNDAVIALLDKGVPIEQTIRSCTDVRKFIVATKATGGATFDGDYLGKVIRWVYRRNETRDIRKVKPHPTTGTIIKVPSSDGAMPLMTLPEQVPPDIDYDRYVQRAKTILRDIGVTEEKVLHLMYGDSADLFV